MDRKKRIRFVAVATVGLVNLFVAFIDAPLIAVMLWPGPAEFSADSDSMTRSLIEAHRIADVANTISFVCLFAAGACFVYLLAALAAWFIGKPDVADSDTT